MPTLWVAVDRSPWNARRRPGRTRTWTWTPGTREGDLAALRAADLDPEGVGSASRRPGVLVQDQVQVTVTNQDLAQVVWSQRNELRLAV